jgi:C1A family cysteine protease
MSTRQYILARDTPDARDSIYAPKKDELRRKLPTHVDLRSRCPRVQDQGSPGTCTAHAVAAALAFELRVHHAEIITPSRLFIFYNERALTGQTSVKCVVRLRDALKAVSKSGVCPEVMWPYHEDSRVLRLRPSKDAFKAAIGYKIAKYHRIPIGHLKPEMFLQHLKYCLAEGHPFVFGFLLYPSFETEAVKKSGVMPIPDRKHEKLLGGHAVMAVGYDDRRKAVLVRNSWGTDWGIKGHFWMPYELVKDPTFAHDFWTVRGVKRHSDTADSN